jgi:hypothetical protein
VTREREGRQRDRLLKRGKGGKGDREKRGCRRKAEVGRQQRKGKKSQDAMHSVKYIIRWQSYKVNPNPHCLGI